MPDQKNKTNQSDKRVSYDSVKEQAGDAARRAAQGLEQNPLGVVVGGLAVGALVGALLPRSQKEKELLAPVGQKLGETARAATQAAREAGMAELDQRGLTKSAVKDQAKGVVQNVVKAVTSAGTAAGTAATQAATGHGDAQQDQSDEGAETMNSYQPAGGMPQA